MVTFITDFQFLLSYFWKKIISMKKIAFALLSVSLLFIATACTDNENPEQSGVLELTFKGDFGADPLMMYAQEYPYEAGMAVKFQLFRFYLSDVTLLKTPGEMQSGVKVSDVELVDFKDIQSADAAQKGYTIKIENVPAGNYAGLLSGLGVSPTLNKTQPGNYDPTHPLSDNYWSWALGYVFTKIEGTADVDGDGQLTDKITFHIGGDSYYRTKEFNKAFTVKAGETTRLNFEVDLRRILVASADNYLDFKKVTIDHTNNVEIANFISDNLKAAVEIK